MTFRLSVKRFAAMTSSLSLLGLGMYALCWLYDWTYPLGEALLNNTTISSIEIDIVVIGETKEFRKLRHGLKLPDSPLLRYFRSATSVQEVTLYWCSQEEPNEVAIVICVVLADNTSLQKLTMRSDCRVSA
jgi:hypothetical protein